MPSARARRRLECLGCGKTGSPEDVRRERQGLRDLHAEFSGMMICRGGGRPKPGNAEAFERYYKEFLIYG